MSPHIPEPDWKRFKDVRAKLLERYCAQVIEEIATASRGQGTAHERYLKIYKIIEERDETMAKVFDDFRRSTAVFQLGLLRRIKLLTDEELGQFSEPTRAQIEGIASI